MDLALLIVATWIFSTCFHEFGHAITAYWGGDKSVKEKGYLTLNPLVYFHSATTLVIPVLALMLGAIPLPGAAVMINHNRIKSKAMLSLVSFAGPLFTLIFTAGLVVFLNILPSLKATIGSAHVYNLLVKGTHTLIYLEVFVFMLNMLPLPPLDGFGIIEPWLPKPIQRKAREMANIGFIAIMALFWFCDPFSDFMRGTSRSIAASLGVDFQYYVRSGLRALTANSYPLMGLILVAWIIKGKNKSPVEQADKLMKEQKFREALQLYDTALTKKEDSRVLVASATCLLSLGRKEDALVRADRAVALDPDSTQSLGIKAACLAETGNLENALDTVEKAIKSDTNDYYIFNHFVKAAVLNQMDRCEEALAADEVYLKRNPNDIEALFVKGECLQKLDRFDEAIGVYDKAARTAPGSSIRSGLAKGLLLCSLSRTQEGIAEFNKFLPEDPEQRTHEIFNLKRLLAETGAKLDAKGQHERADAARQAIESVK